MELVVQSGPDAGKVYQVGLIPLVVGRQAGTDIMLSDWQVSRRHAQFELANGIVLVNDLGSANGTLVNGQRLAPNQPRPLMPGDQVQLGSTTLVVRPVAPALNSNPNQYLGNPATPLPIDSYGPTYAPRPATRPVDMPPNYPPSGYQQPGPSYPAQPQRPAYPVKKKGNGLLIGGIVGIVVLAAGAIGLIVALGSQSQAEQNSGVFNPPTSAVGISTPLPVVPTATPVVGLSGNNALPPTPPAATAPRPTTAPSRASGNSVAALGVSVTFPTNWKTFIDEGKNVIQASAPDGVTYSQVRRLAGLKGSAVERLNTYLEAISRSVPDVKVVQPVKSLSNDAIAEVYITYTDKDDNLVRRDRILANAGGSTGDTYFISFSTEDQKFDTQVSIFDTILSSVQSQP